MYSPYFQVAETSQKGNDALVRLHLVPKHELEARRADVARSPLLRPVPIEISRNLLITQPSPGGVRKAADQSGVFVYQSDPQRRHVDVWAASPGPLLLEGVRVVRTVLVSLLVHERAHVPVHASCVALHGRAVMFTGSSGAGKTTLALAAMRRLGARFVTNDLVMLRVADDRVSETGRATVTAFGMPLPVRMAAGTLQNLGLLQHLDPYQEVFPFVDTPDWHERERKIEIGSHRVASWFGTTPQPSADLACLVWPRVATGDVAGLTALPAREVPGRLRAEIPDFDPAWPVWTGFGYPAPLPMPHAAVVSEECAKADALELRGGRNVDAAIDALADFLESRASAASASSADPEVA
ncbi:HPr kinase/phosphorylase [Streptomyces mirabilis]|uniref:HPr kinase/phosphorylase n=1 Tax=Streptomyces mirabilis TaxID=68239 RepID=UPI00382DFED9